MRRFRFIFVSWTTLLALSTGSSLTRADDAAVKRCRQLADSVRRLACYDAIPVPATDTGPPRQSPNQFGLEVQSPAREISKLESQVVGPFEGWSPRTRIELANGQVWQIADDSSAVLKLLNPKVSIRRGLLGAFYLDIEGTNRTPRVKRVQ